MALTDFAIKYATSYQEIFQKVLRGKVIANFRFEKDLKFGDTVTRILPNIDGVLVRSVTIGSDRTVDSITDSEESLTINYHKGTTFALSTKEIIQAGPLDPASYIGGKVAMKTAIAVDADILYETVNAAYDFDNGDLTTGASTGTAITLSSTTVPQMVARMPAKLRNKNQIENVGTCFVVDAYGLSDISQYLMGKQVDPFASTFKNGLVEGINVGGAEVYVSENLTGEAVLAMATNPTDGDTVTVGGLTFTFKATPVNPGAVDIGGSADASRANLAAAINQGAGAGTTYIAFTAAADLDAVSKLSATNDDTENTLTVVGRGTGRLNVSETFTDGTDTWSKSFIHCYFGKKGAIDVVMQEEVDMEMREEPKQRASNIMSDALYGVKTFTDGSKKFLDVLINA